MNQNIKGSKIAKMSLAEVLKLDVENILPADYGKAYKTVYNWINGKRGPVHSIDALRLKLKALEEKINDQKLI